MKLTNTEIRNQLINDNKQVFENVLPSIPHEVIITGRWQKNGEEYKPRFVTKTNPSEAAAEAGVAKVSYLRASVQRAVDLTDGFRGSKKPTPANIFQPTQPNMFLYFKKEIMPPAENFDYLSQGKAGSEEELPIIKMQKYVYGNIITLMVPPYRPQVINADGKRSDLKATRFDAHTGKYVKDTVTMDTITFFADDDDLKKLLSVATKHFENQVAPYIVGDKKTLQLVGDKIVSEEVADRKAAQDEKDLAGGDTETEKKPETSDNDEDDF